MINLCNILALTQELVLGEARIGVNVLPLPGSRILIRLKVAETDYQLANGYIRRLYALFDVLLSRMTARVAADVDVLGILVHPHVVDAQLQRECEALEVRKLPNVR